jgi:hypothetical protein
LTVLGGVYGPCFCRYHGSLVKQPAYEANMPIRILFAFVMMLVIAGPALAGTVTAEGGKISWQSTQCTAPSPPGSLPSNPETRANEMNAGVTAHNAFGEKVQAYDACLGSEAEHDANAASASIVAAAQAMIDAEQKKATEK